LKSNIKKIIWPLAGLVILALALLPACSAPVPTNTIYVTLSEAIKLSKSNNVKSIVVDPGSGTMTIMAAVTNPPLQITDVNGKISPVTEGVQLVTNIDSLNLANLQQLGLVLPADYSTTASSNNSGLGSSLIIWIPFILILVLMFFFLRSGSNVKSQVSNFGRSKARLDSGAKSTVTFTDVAGIEEAKQDLAEVVDFLKNRAKFQAVGARIPKGILLVGPPGTGKTLLARAVAGEAGVPFFSISGSEFVEVYVGVGASRVRDLFEQAKQNKPCIIFIDEIDAVGRRRGSGFGGSHEEREQTLNQILTEMDGFTPNTGVIVLAATNRPDVLDPALLRPGRFDRRIMLDPPDAGERLAILKVHTAGKPFEKSVDLETIAKETHGFSGADLANLVNEAAILTARRNKTSIGMDEMEESIDRIVAGPQKKSRKISQQEKKVAAYHEAGHALVARMLPNADPVHKVSVTARGGMGGFTRLLPTEERYLMTRSQFKDTLATFLGGHAAEEMVFHEVTTGPHSDIKQATSLARKMITEYGMSEKLPLRTFGGGEEEQAYFGVDRKDYGEEVAKQIDDEVRNLIDTAHQTARKILQENEARLVHLGEKLVVSETLEGPELEKAFNEPLSPEENTEPPAQKLQPPKIINPGRPGQGVPQPTG
jgi:cell division protease FtsH